MLASSVQAAESLDTDIVRLETSIQEEQVGKEDSEERTRLLEKFTELQSEHDKLTLCLGDFQDPREWNEKKDQADKFKEAANLYTDNIFALQSWARDKHNIDGREFAKMFNCPPDLDYV